MTPLIPCQRHLFDLPDGVSYLNCAYMSPLLRTAVAAGEEGVGRKRYPWNLKAQDFYTGPDRLRSGIARLAGGTPDDWAIVPSVSYGIATAAANLPLAAGQEVLVLDEAFPSMVYAWRAVARRSGATIVTVPRPADDDWTAAVLDRITARTAVASLPHCHWTDGGLLDLAAIATRLRTVGAALVVDATQSLGALPLDLPAVAPDFLVAAGYKWLLGPYGLGYLYVAPHRHDGRPLEQTWIGRAGSEDFAALTRLRDDYQPGARRFDAGEMANFILVPMAIAALDVLEGWTIPAVQVTVAALVTALVEAAAPLGFRAVPAPYRAGHYLGLRAPNLPDDLLTRLAGEGIHVSRRGTAVRVTPHVYNDAGDLDRLVSALGRAMDGAGRPRFA